MNLDHVNYSFVDNVTQIPVYTGDCLYVCDLDDTLLKQYYIFNKKGIKLSSGKTIYRREVTGLHHPDIPQWMSIIPHLIYLTARDQSSFNQTVNDLVENNLRYAPIIFSQQKGHALKAYLDKSPIIFDKVIFIDDKDYNIRQVKVVNPNVECYRVAPQVVKKHFVN